MSAEDPVEPKSPTRGMLRWMYRLDMAWPLPSKVAVNRVASVSLLPSPMGSQPEPESHHSSAEPMEPSLSVSKSRSAVSS